METVGPQTLSQAIEKVINLTQNPLPVDNYLDGFKKWLEDRTNDWDKTNLRIGLVGITSAGKSTFINALAGEDILPRGAQPTSGILVVCRKSEERKLKVLFRDQNEFDFDGEECNPTWVKRYADEEENPDNEQNVQEMQLYLPKLAIPAKYDLIDSPGLDAFGLKGHEELTLRTLIPLVDIVLFLTTTKSTSDRENLKALGKICREEKPAIVVQTHKDAVEPRYMKGGKILESAEEVLQKHHKRVKDLLEQSMGLKDAYIVQVSSIQALNSRLQSPDTPCEKLEEWEESGFEEVVAVLSKLHDKLSQRIAGRRLHLLIKEIQILLDRVKTDYFSSRGKEKEAQHYRDAEKKRLDELQSAIPSEKEATFPDVNKFQKDIAKVKDFFLDAIDFKKEKDLETLSATVRDKIKAIETNFFEKADEIDKRLKKLAEELSIDLQAITPDEQKDYTHLPQIKRYEKIVKVEILEESGVGGKAKRLIGKLLKKKKWGYAEKNVTESFVDRESLKEDLSDYHSLYSVRLLGYLKQWVQNWINSSGAVLSAISQRRDDLNSKPLDVDPEPFRRLLGDIRAIRDWMEGLLVGDHTKKKQTMGFNTMSYTKKQKSAMTTRTESNLSIALPLLQGIRTLVFTRKTHRFWYVVKQICTKDCPSVLISTPFSQEILDYFMMIGELSLENEDDLNQHVIVCSRENINSLPQSMPIKPLLAKEQNQRDYWFLQKNHIILCHDQLLENPAVVEAFPSLLEQMDVIFRVIDLHQIGHERMRLDKLPVRDHLDKVKSKLAYIGVGAGRLLKGGQFIDAFKSYTALKNAPGFGLLPFVLADGEDLLNSLLWLANTLGKEDSFGDRAEAFKILQQTQADMVKGRENFINDFFEEVKQFRKAQSLQESLNT